MLNINNQETGSSIYSKKYQIINVSLDIMPVYQILSPLPTSIK